MSILDVKIDAKDIVDKKLAPSEYMPTKEEQEVRSMILNHFRLGDLNMQKPRLEFNDLSLLQRKMIDQMSFNTYQPNNGEPAEGDILNGWRSNAIRPIVRNKCMSIAAHATARLIFPKIFAYDEQSDEQHDAAIVMRDLMEWAGDQMNYKVVSLEAILTSLWSPASIIYEEYVETYRDVKREKGEDGKYKIERILDETLSGFQATIVPVNELYIENFYEHDIQKQGWLIWRRVKNYSLLKSQYEKKYKNFKYVTPGVQVIYNDANQTFYPVYDSNMRGEMCEEIIYWNRNMDLKIIMVNGVMLTEYDNANPRIDKLYPFDKFGFELFDEGKCFYYKSLAFKLQQDANIVNTLYPMIIDGTYLNVMPPMILNGGETIEADVIVPGAVTTLKSKDAQLQPVQLANNLQAGMNTLMEIEKSVEESSEVPSISTNRQTSAYEVSVRKQQQEIMMGIFIDMIGSHVVQFGKLLKGDILQYLTIADVTDIVGNTELVYKTFLMMDRNSNGKSRTRKIKFDSSLPSDPMTEDQKLKESYKVLQEEGDTDSKTEIYKVNPEIFRKLKYMVTVSPDILNPLSEEAEKAFKLEAYDRAIQNQFVDQEKVTRDFLFGAYDFSKRDPDMYMKKEEVGDSNDPLAAMKSMMGGGPAGMSPSDGMPPAGNPPVPSQPNTNQLANQQNQLLNNAK